MPNTLAMLTKKIIEAGLEVKAYIKANYGGCMLFRGFTLPIDVFMSLVLFLSLPLICLKMATFVALDLLSFCHGSKNHGRVALTF